MGKPAEGLYGLLEWGGHGPNETQADFLATIGNAGAEEDGEDLDVSDLIPENDAAANDEMSFAAA